MARGTTRRTVVAALVLALLLLGACGSDGSKTASGAGSGSSSSALATTTTSASATTTTGPKACPNPDGGICLGSISAGTYHTQRFVPSLEYAVPDGWANMEDLSGNFLLLPPGSKLAGVNPGTSDFLGVYTSVAAPAQCKGVAGGTIATTPQAMIDSLRSQPTLITTDPKAVTVGGLSGFQVDVSFNAAAADTACHQGSDVFTDVIVGVGRSSLVHSVLADYPMRLTLLSFQDGVLAIEVADAPNGGSDYPDWFGAAAGVVDTFQFTAG